MRISQTFWITLVSLMAWSRVVGGEPEEKVTLTFIWHAGDRANLFQKIARQYTAETGVEITALLPPMTNEWYQRIADEFAGKGSAFDLCMFDSQNMSEFASQGHVVRLNDLLRQSRKINAADFDASALRRYACRRERKFSWVDWPLRGRC